jgi:hypothetical protein
MAKSNNLKNKNDKLIGKLTLIIASTALLISLSLFIWLAMYASSPIHEQQLNDKVKQITWFHQLSWCYDNDVKPCHAGDPDFWGKGKPYSEMMQQMEDQKWKDKNGED